MAAVIIRLETKRTGSNQRHFHRLRPQLLLQIGYTVKTVLLKHRQTKKLEKNDGTFKTTTNG
jgi:hypothetical protein